MVLRSFAVLFLVTSNAFASDWTIVPDRSQLTFEGTQAGTSFQGSFADFSTAITLDPTDLENSSISVEIVTASATSGSAERDGALPGADWFDVATHPTASFVSSFVTKTDANLAACRTTQRPLGSCGSPEHRRCRWRPEGPRTV